MTYDEAVRYLLTLGRELAAPTQAAAAKFDLENINVLAERLGRPERCCPCVHIAGTNGKGSTAAFLESALRCAGFRTGLNTSPHLERINERIRVNGREISDAAFAETFTRIHAVIEELLAKGKLRAHPTYFECVTAMAFAYFAREKVEFAVFEVGLGGRLDATNVVQPAVSVISRIDFDHENFLGHSLREIAGEKAGIIKLGVPVVMAEQQDEAREVIVQRAQQLAAPLIDVAGEYAIEETDLRQESPLERKESGHLRKQGVAGARVVEKATGWGCEVTPSLRGRFQLRNALSAVAAARMLQTRGFRIEDAAIERGIAEAAWPGRLEKLQDAPEVYLDGAHNPGAARELVAFWTEQFAGRRIWLVYGALRDKAVDEIAGLLFPHAAEVILTEPRTSRAISARQLEDIAAHHAKSARVITSADQAVEFALAQAASEDAIFITGSLYLVGQIRQWWKTRAPTEIAARQL